MKNILVPTDFSKTANKALDYALKLANCFDANIHLFNSYDVPHSGATLMVSIDDLLAADSKKNLDILQKKTKSNYPEISISTHSYSGPVNDAILRFIKMNEIDIVIMGTTGASGITGKLFGSNTASLVQNLKIPLIVIPDKSESKDPSRIGISTDMKIEMTDVIYNPVREISLAFGSKINFFNVNNTYKQDELDKMEKDFGIEVDFVYGHDIEESIKEYLDEVKIDLLVLVAEKHSIFHKIFKPSISKNMAKELEIPMLILAQ